jgi:hypothetical protein
MLVVLKEGRSTSIKAFETDVDEKTLIVEFNAGIKYKYSGVSKGDLGGLLSTWAQGESIGKYFCKHIKPVYKYEKLEEGAA